MVANKVKPEVTDYKHVFFEQSLYKYMDGGGGLSLTGLGLFKPNFSHKHANFQKLKNFNFKFKIIENINIFYLDIKNSFYYLTSPI